MPCSIDYKVIAMKKQRSTISGSSAPSSSPGDNDFYHRVFESMEDYAVFTTDKAGIITSWNQGAERVLGYREDEVVQKSCSVLFTKSDIETGEPEKELKNALKYGRAVDERFHLKKGGGRFWASGKVFPIYDSTNKHIGFTKVMRNLTGRLQAEETLTKARSFADGIIAWAAEPILVLNDDLTVSTVNDAFLKSFGIARKKSFHMPLHKFANGYFDKPEFNEITHELKNGSGTVSNREISQQLRDNDNRILLVNGWKASPDTDTTIYMLSVQDITERRMLEQQKDDFISIASHEIRTPLTVIKATAQMLDRRFKGFEHPEIIKAAAKINEKTDKLLTLIKYLLDASQIAVNELVMRPEQFSLNDLVTESVNELSLIYPGIALQVRGKIKEPIWGDRFRISQVLNNLLNNAIKYSPTGEAIIIRMRKNRKKDRAIVSVQDCGIGIPKEEQKNLFKRFWRASTARKRNISGIGLGLHISNQIIKSHKGKLWLRSDTNKGSTFTFSIPLMNPVR